METFLYLLLTFLITSVFGIVKFEKIENVYSSNKSVLVYEAEAMGKYLHLNLEVIRPLDHLYLKVNLFKEEQSKFRELFKSPQIEYCKVISKKSRSNPMIRTFVVPALKAVPNFAKCPVYGAENFNVTFDSKMLTMFPNSRYMLIAHAYREDDNELIKLTLVVKLEN
ncbi:hypothetical protein PVAND_016502 [Polypedilum vanderplanki]|uniref:Uncharacterized protein n=1 Tax=Polypedilum vanderplanki TaxID=319348 RepID=A0A9J6BFL7_POLVA|nr:hypothetical protein PVAND_016502 [Polypedilum vanderplanki]